MYKFTNEYKKLSPELIWQSIQSGLSNDVTIKSIKGKIPYTLEGAKLKQRIKPQGLVPFIALLLFLLIVHPFFYKIHFLISQFL
jgi:hypothetical protein